ncbi:NERD domain-containing protein [Wolinella succinogenes]|uniref:Uncharacterized protein n=1 Tax=Wolinella succinogenes (strain ATCC 29543 / DSM 1740 / CCUG 13145 / JCM 31913 / LMG 7466 / NCTC 11488 / FDC 602W) TaxID=273121 RepID=Q7MS95_WOLSU|nr:NERD domain-containing protein [Wolinella succinogenes]CAE09783.1 hypothetical protein WS0652 [Wolinella succinogenes]VEG81998.1 Uncharacterised protein [Wolinella succinogenes]
MKKLEIKSKNIEKGKEGEESFKEWLESCKLSYLYVNQNKETFASMFGRGEDQAVKRPDFLVLFEGTGLIAVDVKNYSDFDHNNKKGYLIDNNRETKLVLCFERLFRIPVWYVYLDNKNDSQTWLWISALKVIEAGEPIKKKGIEDKSFISESCFSKVSKGDDLGKLWTERFSAYRAIKDAEY